MIASLSATLPAYAITASEAFVRLPATELSILPAATRLNMIDYYAEADSLWEAPNAMEGVSQLQEVGPTYLKVKLTPVSDLQIKVLPGKNAKQSDVIMTLYTIGSDSDDFSDGADTEIRFYDAQMQPLKTEKYFKMPDFKKFFTIPRGSITTIKELQQMLPFTTVMWTASADSDNIVGKMTFTDAISQDDLNIIRLFATPLTLRWKKGKFN